MEIMIKREIDPKTFTRPMVIYAARESVGFSPDNEGCRRCVTINPGYECLIELSEDESVVYAAIGNEPEVTLVATLNLENSEKMRKFAVKCKDELSKSLEFEFSEVDLKKEWFKKLDLGATVAIAISTLIILVGGFFGVRELSFYCRSWSKAEQDFVKEEISITLTKAFVEYDFPEKSENDYVAYMTPNDMWVTVGRQNFEKFPEIESWTPMEYCEEIRKYPMEGDVLSDITVTDGIPGYSFTRFVEGERLIFELYVFRTDGAFWRVIIGGPEDSYEYWKDCIPKWVESIEF